MIIIFPDNPLNQTEVDPDFQDQWEAAQASGFECALISFEAIVRGASDIQDICKNPSSFAGQLILYRGWMLKPKSYERLFKILQNSQAKMITDPDTYRMCHYLPESYRYIEAHTPHTTWLKIEREFSIERILGAVAEFEDKPLILKDYVKSQKHLWHEACFMPSASDAKSVESVSRRFLELQDDDLNEGLVFREFIPLRQIGVHPKSGLPLHLEFRVFFADHRPIAVAPYWDQSIYPAERPSIGPFEELAKSIPSRFFTMDIAKTKDNNWIVIELGDGQVSGLPESQPHGEFYEELFRAFAI